jgi:hypothetical protein
MIIIFFFLSHPTFILKCNYMGLDCIIINESRIRFDYRKYESLKIDSVPAS